MSLIQITESEKNRISDLHKKFQTEVNEKRITLKEGIQVPNEEPINEVGGGMVGRFFARFSKGFLPGLKTIFKSTDAKVLEMVNGEMSKVVNRLVKSNSDQVSMTAIKASPGYKKSLSVLVENLSQSKYNLPYERLLQKEKDAIIKQASKGLNETITTQLKNAGKAISSNIDNLKGAKLVKMGQKTNQITRTINGLSKTKLDKASSLIKGNAKLVGSGKSGASLLNKVKSGKVNVVKNGEIFSASTKSLGDSNVKVFRITKSRLAILAGLGITGLGVLYLIGKMNPSEDPITVQDEDGNDITDDNNTSGGGGSTSTSTGGGKTGKFHDCENKDFPLEFGCKSTKIAEVQKCLGVVDDGKLGPKTMKAIEDNKYDTSRGLSKDVYDAIKSNCGTPTKPETKPEDKPETSGLNLTDLAPTTPGTTTVSGDKPTDTQLTAEPDGSTTTKSGEEIFNELKDAGLLKMRGNSIILKDKNNRDESIDIPSSEINKLNQYLKTFGDKNGYYLSKNKNKRYGDKYKWSPND
jgi:hypothetical protein